MHEQSTIGTIILLFTALVTYKAFKDSAYKKKYIFHVDRILIAKEYGRLISSGFLHANWLHFGFNMIALLGFSLSLENQMGYINYLIIYFASLIGGSLLALYIHRNHGDYRALGASGAVSGIVLASIVLFPAGEISFIFVPIGIPSWIFAILFMAISFLGIKSQSDNIGHEAHLGGALTGVLMTAVLQPGTVLENLWIFALIVIPIALFLFTIIQKPEILLTNNWSLALFKKSEQRNPKKKISRSEKELDRILDKIRLEGIDSLSSREKRKLEDWRKGI